MLPGWTYDDQVVDHGSAAAGSAWILADPKRLAVVERDGVDPAVHVAGEDAVADHYRLYATSERKGHGNRKSVVVPLAVAHVEIVRPGRIGSLVAECPIRPGPDPTGAIRRRHAC